MSSYIHFLFLRFFAPFVFLFFFFNDTATTEIYTLSLHDALPIYLEPACGELRQLREHTPVAVDRGGDAAIGGGQVHRSEEHTSELQSLAYLVCRLLLEKKKKKRKCTLIAK